MSRILVIAEHDGAKLSPAIARCVHCATQVPGAEVTVAVFAADASAVAAQAAAIAGVAKVLKVEQAANARPVAALIAPQVAALAAGYTHVFGPSTTFGKDLMPRIAALIDAPQVSDLMAVESATRFRRPIYAGNAITTVEVEAGVAVVATVRVASFTAAGTGGTATIEPAASAAELPTHTRYLGLAAAKSDRPDLQSAARVVSGGRALGSAENFQLVMRLADKLGAAVGASRAAVDAGYAPNELQVGQTGKIIAPDLYIALGISGAIQHLTGIKDARTIVAVNKDPEAPIFQVADFGLVGDLFQVVPELERLLG
jgi:electron transfer flavoprotein alpha subunit